MSGVDWRRWRVLALLLLVAGLLGSAIVSMALDQGEQRPLEVDGRGEVRRLLAGLEQRGSTLGDPDAPLTISIFNDLQCSPCARWQLEVVPVLVDELVRERRARLRYRQFSVSQRSVGIAFFAAAAAAEQGRGWEYAQLFLANQDLALLNGVDERLLSAIAGAAPGLDPGLWRRDRERPEVARAVEADAAAAFDLRLPAQPAAVVNGPGGSRTLTRSPSAAAILRAAAAVRY